MATILSTAANCDMSAIKTAIQSAHDAQLKYFSETTATSRGQLLTKWHGLLMSNIDDCVENFLIET